LSILKRCKDFVRWATPSSLWMRLRVLHIHYKRNSYGTRHVRHTFGGLPLLVELKDPDSAGWYDRDWEPLPEIEFLKDHRLVPGARVFDVGAHQGVVAMMLASRTAPGLVVAVEGNGFNAAAAERNASLNHLENIRVVHGAAAAEPGELLFSESSNGSVNKIAWGQTKVRAYTLDELSETYGLPDLLFIDVEGYEVEVLKGARRTLAGRPDCFVEVHTGCGLEDFGYVPADVQNFFSQQDYDLFIRQETDPAFLPKAFDAPLPQSRFFLIALARQASAPPNA